MSNFGTLVFYLFLIFTSTALTKVAYKNSPSKLQKNFLVFLVIFLLALFAGLRYETGTDWHQYYLGVDYVGRQGNTEWGAGKDNYGLIYILICRVVYWLGGDGSVLLFIMAFLTYLFLFLTLDRYKEQIDVHISVFMYMAFYYLVTYNIVRQALAITVGMYAISFLDFSSARKVERSRRKRLRNFIADNFYYLLFSVISSQIHNSGIMCFLAWPLCYTMKRKKTRWIILIAVFIAVLNFQRFMSLAIVILDSDVFSWYFTLWGERGSYVAYFLRYLPYVLACGLAYKNIDKDERMINLYNLFLVGLIVNSLSVRTNTEIERVIFVYLYMIIVIVPFALKNMRASGSFYNQTVRFGSGAYALFRFGIYAFILFTFYYIFFMKGSYEVVPYKFII